jgi:hypothetical protein
VEEGEVTINVGSILNSDAMEISGRVNFNNGVNRGMRITATNSTQTYALFEPTIPEEGLVGSFSRPFCRMYSGEFYALSALEYKTFSDRSLKDNILPIRNTSDKISDLEGVSYALIESPLGKHSRPMTKMRSWLKITNLDLLPKIWPRWTSTRD